MAGRADLLSVVEQYLISFPGLFMREILNIFRMDSFVAFITRSSLPEHSSVKLPGERLKKVPVHIEANPASSPNAARRIKRIHSVSDRENDVFKVIDDS